MNLARRVQIWPLDGGAARDYDLHEQLGSGAMGSVHRAYDLELGRWVALKVLAGEEREAQPQRFLREGRAVAALSHPGVVPLYGAGLLEGRPCLILALIEDARPLDKAWQGASLQGRLDLLLQVCDAMNSAHTAGIVHRDLKPDNILVNGDGRAFVSDFGVALMADSERMTRTGAMVGTISTMAPEQIVGDRARVGPASDVWALGVLLYLAFTDQFPFEGATLPETMARIARASPQAPRELNPSLTRALEEVCLGCLQADPGRRYPDAGALGQALALAREASDSPARTRGRLLVGLGVVSLLVLGAALLPWARGEEESTPSPSLPARGTPSEPRSSSPSPTKAHVAPYLVQDQEFDLRRGEWRSLAATRSAIWIGGGSRVSRYPRVGAKFGQLQTTSVKGFVWGIVSVGDRVWIAHGERAPAQGRDLPPAQAWVSLLSPNAKPEVVWTGKSHFGRRGWFLAWNTAGGETRLLFCAETVLLLSLDAEGHLADERSVKCPAEWIRGAVPLPGSAQFALCGNSKTQLGGFVGVYDERTGALAWTVVLAGTAAGLAASPAGGVLVGKRESHSVLHVQSSDPLRGPYSELAGPKPSGAIQDLLSREGWLYSLSSGVGDPELEVTDALTGRRVQRLSVPRAYGARLVWDEASDRLWLVSSGRTLSFRDSKRAQ